MTRPILLWMTSRSRSSMVSAIFIEHGVWWGNTPATISGYEMNENQNIKKILKKYKSKWGRPYMRAIAADDDVFQNFQDDLARVVPSDKTWMMKTGVEYFPAYESLNPYNVFITRNPEDTARSLSDKRHDVDFEDALKTANWRFNFMKQLQLQHGGIFVSTDKIITGDFSDIQQAIEYCDIVYNEEATKKAIIK